MTNAMSIGVAAAVQDHSKPQAKDDAKTSTTSEDADRDAVYELDDSTHPSSKPTKKKRRVIKTPDKKYQCPADDCGKSYSRAEHLYRHQLNRMYS